MAKPRCPKCKRESTYNAKYDQCSGCGRGYEEREGVVATTTHTEDGEEIYVHVEPSTEPIVQGRASLPLVPGEPCPACGKPVGKTSAQLQREYRERKKAE